MYDKVFPPDFRYGEKKNSVIEERYLIIKTEIISNFYRNNSRRTRRKTAG